jgi:hypothetical protein
VIICGFWVNPTASEILDQLLVFRVEIVEQLLGLGVGQHVGHVVLDDLGQMGGDHRRRIDHREAAERSVLAQDVGDPHRRQPEGGLDRRLAGQVDGIPLGVHHQQHVGAQLAGAGFDLLDADHIGLGRKLHVVLDAHRRQHEAHLVGELAAQALDLVGQQRSLGIVDQRQQRVAQLDPDVVEPERGGDRLLGHLGLGGFGGGDLVGRHHLSLRAVPGEAAGAER